MSAEGGQPASWTRRHLLDVADLSTPELEQLMARAEAVANDRSAASATPADLRGRRLVLLFAEPSTRTRFSFEIAARRLGADVLLFEAQASSLSKGETIPDTVRTLEALGVDLLVMRHGRSGAPWLAAAHFAGHVINAGDGWHAHPTQALLDLYTLRQAFGSRDLRGRKVAIVGDILHSRVCRSNLWTLTAAGADVRLCAPRQLLAGFDEWAAALPAERRFSVTDDLAQALRGADAVMGLRIQRERMAEALLGAMGEYIKRYQLTEERLAAQASPAAFFLHPGPINEGVEVSAELARGPRSLVREQVRNGVPVRMAVLALVANGDAAA